MSRDIPISRFHGLWNRAVNEHPPSPHGAAGELMQALQEILDVDLVEYGQVGGRSAQFLLNLSPLGFKGMDLNVVIVTHPPTDDSDARDLADLIADYKSAVQSIGFCFLMTLQDKPPEPNPFISSISEVVYICGEDMERLFSSSHRPAALFDIIRRQVPLQRLCPFNTTREARGSMFRGRKTELSRLTEDLDVQFLVTGARLIGKTSLLMRAYNVMRVRPDMKDSVFYFDCSVWGGFMDCAHRLAREVELRKDMRIDLSHRNVAYLLERRSAGGRRPIVLLFDEFDGLVDRESTTGWQFLSFLHEAVTNNWVRVAFSGFRSVPGLQQGRESPFYGSLHTLTLEPLSANETMELLWDPLRLVGVQTRDPGALSKRVYRSSGGHPFLVQFYGEQLFRRAAESEPQEITVDDIKEIEEGFELSRFLKSHFLRNTTLRGQPVADERVCALVYAHDGSYQGWTDQDFWQACQSHSHPLSLDQINEALNHLYDARILSFAGRKYTFTFPLMKDILTSSYPNVQALLDGM